MGMTDERLDIEVITIHPGGRRQRKVINHNDHDDRVWLGKHCFWAFRNGVEIRTRAVDALRRAIGE